MKKIIIALDGPAGSGKTTTARFVAKQLEYIYIDTGAMYRAVTLAWIKSGSELSEAIVNHLVENLTINLEQSEHGQKTILNGIDVSDEIRLPEVTKFVSPISAMGYVREVMVSQQRIIGKNGGVVMDGRDIGTVVFPNAELKIYLIASIEARAERRLSELKSKNIDISYDEMRSQLIYRDHYDSSREISPLHKAIDAIEIDTSNLSIEQQTTLILDLAHKSILSQ